MPDRTAAAPATSSSGERSSVRAGRFSLARRLLVSSLVIGTLLAAALGTAAWAYSRQVSAREHLVDVVDKARLEAQALLGDYVNEESGVRGYILSHQLAFLQPWQSGLAAAVADRKALGALEARDPRSEGLLAGVDAAAQKWQRQFAYPAIADTAKHNSTYASQAKLNVGKHDFDALRARFGALDHALDASAAASTTTLDQSQTTFVLVFAVLVLIVVLSGAYAGWALRSWVTGPLGRLGGDVRLVASGRLDHHVALDSPPDLARLAADVDAMRARILAEVLSLAQASEELTELNADLQRSNQELEQFAYVASHDLQEPLRKVVSFCQLLDSRYSDQLDDRARQYIVFAVDGATRMQGLINDLLSFSRVGRTTSQFSTVALGAVVGQAESNLETVLAEKNATVNVGELPSVRGDPALLSALFQNLIGNGIKFNQSAAPEVNVAAQKDGEYWRVSVSDNGIGIEPRFAERIFVIFQRLHGRDLYSGTGIGLAMSKKIVEFHGGRIWLDTSFAPGTRMCFTLPVLGTRP